MKSFQQNGEEFLGVVLLEAHELGSFLGDDAFDVPRGDVFVFSDVKLGK